MPSIEFEENVKELSRIVTDLRQNWKDGITTSNVEEETQALRCIQKIDFKKKGWPLTSQTYGYEDTKFPPIPEDVSFRAPKHEVRENIGPRTLAEALLWKKGDWGKYVNFVSDFKSKKLNPKFKKGGPVFFAFAKHLQDRNARPILDQHSVRALWVLSNSQWNLPGEPYRRFLLEGKIGEERWRTSQTPKKAANLVISNFWDCVTSTCAANEIDLTILDELLMPLGQALKHYSKKRNSQSHYEGLIKITGLVGA